MEKMYICLLLSDDKHVLDMSDSQVYLLVVSEILHRPNYHAA